MMRLQNNMKYSKKMYEELIPVIHNVWTLPSILQPISPIFPYLLESLILCPGVAPSRFG